MAVAAADGSKPIGVATPRVGTSVGPGVGFWLDKSGLGVGTSVGAADESEEDGSLACGAGCAGSAEAAELEAEV
jgi:hypothetical protein